MIEETTNVDEGEITLLLQTLGVEDQPVEFVHTLTMRAVRTRQDSRPEAMLPQLPRLMEGGKTSTLPELRIKGVLGEGGMGLVELAEQISMGRDVAVKKVREHVHSTEAMLNLLREGWTTGLLEHPNIVPVYTLGRDEEDGPVIVMKRIEGTSWLEVIRDPSRAPRAFDGEDPYDVHVEILTQVCNAIHYAHSRGIIHRDLKPENVMLGEFGEVYVLDWGIAVSLDEDPSGRLAMAQDVSSPAGTPAYMAPEMVDGQGEHLGVHSDIFLLGAMLHEALTGAPPHRGDTLYQILIQAHICAPPTFDEEVPPELAEICRKALAREPVDRFAGAGELREALGEYRRSRESRRLASQGDARLGALRQLLKREGGGEDIDDNTIYRTLGSCRFAYEQALEVVSNNSRAADGLQEALETMIAREIDREAHKAAALLIADLPRQNQTLEARLEELGAKIADKDEDYEALQRIRYNIDVEVGRGSRTSFAIIMGIFWAVVSLSLSTLIETGVFELTYPMAFSHVVFLTLVLGAVIYVGRARFFENELNRRIIHGVLAAFIAATFLRGMSWMSDIPIRTALANEMLLYGFAGCMLAVSLDRRLFAAGIPFIVAALVSTAVPELVFWSFSAANVLSMSLLVFIWWPTKESGQIVYDADGCILACAETREPSPEL